MSDLTVEQKKKVGKPLLWIGIASMAMAFAGLTSGYIVSRSSLLETNEWLVFPLPKIFYASTIIILISSFVIGLGVKKIKEGKVREANLLLLVTLILGIAFGLAQLMGWGDLLEESIYFTGPGHNTAGSWVYVLTGFHLAHVTAGLITLLVTWIRSMSGKYTQDNTLGYEMAAIFWHFLDVLWIFLFLFLLFYR
ncbi:MAG: cytochrome c oxidase subunit 3 [Bacteroidota bacterium]|nr:cytochrome c oxidase subunit 3 [Bacteroidota bacterium]MDX5428934.1 cytochrome c oxidase subunit 3 [Bacteroidota bacterium]MDX5447995.1 cytochrome c oxidase subunit 3 [Bacteroidota bacterium]MDX5506614.1 cytochrome c oxidase subunit 3 [Bacteroidota bacterium]